MNERDRTILARLERLPAWPYSWRLLLVIAAAWFFAFFDIGNIADVLPSALRTYHATATLGAAAVSAGLFGYVVGELANSTLSDLRGRRVAIVSAALLYSVGSLINGFSPSLGVFIATRFLVGAGVGATISVMSTYLSEILPTGVRGRYAAWATMPALVGLGVVPLVALAIVPGTVFGWRLLLMVPVLGIVPLLLYWRSIPESPRWLIEHRHPESADQLVSEAEARVARRGRDLPPVSLPTQPRGETGHRKQSRLGLGAIFRPPLLRITVILLLVWLFNYFGAYGIAGVGVTALVQHGFSLTTSIQLTIGGSVGGVVGALVAPHVSDLWVRKWPLFVVTLVLAACLVTLGMAPANWLIFLAFTLLYFQVGFFAPIGYLLTAEHFPTAGRNLGVAVTDGLGHLGGMLGPVAALTVLQLAGFGPMWVMFGVGFILCAIMVSFTQPTTRRTLEAIIETERTQGRAGSTEVGA
ncbi:MAG: MFS transporter [Thermaerobacter sp.]|nr:MFS transporter [Thermaerobacter sp.]